MRNIHLRIARYIVFMLVFVISLSLLGCGSSNNTTSSQSTMSSSKQTSNNADKPLQAGEAAKLDGIEVALDNVTVSKNVSADGEYKYVVLRYKIKNSGSKDIVWDNKNIYWFDTTLGEKKMSIKNTGVKTAAESGTIAAGTTGEFDAVYKVSLSLNSLEFRYYSSPDTDYNAKWKLDITK